MSNIRIRKTAESLERTGYAAATKAVTPATAIGMLFNKTMASSQ